MKTVANLQLCFNKDKFILKIFATRDHKIGESVINSDILKKETC